ncbi:MAG: hypothetical protein M3Q80_02510 [bacterium]|nr:hypothetical protein [bacterium]
MAKIKWKIPSFVNEFGEIERVQRQLRVDTSFVSKFIHAEKTATLVPLTSKIWDNLENTDSNLLGTGSWDYVANCAQHTKRDWETLRDRMMAGAEMDSPIIYHCNGIYHLVSGNTRLMVAKALGITPMVVIIERLM